MAWFHYYQRTPESAWEIADAKLRQSVIDTYQPPFTTILDLDTEIVEDMKREDLDKVRYKGPFYVDFDAESIEDVIPPFQRFLSKLTEIEIDLRQVQLYASGGKGFHVVIPMELFIEKPSSAGYTFLPAVYKEIAQELYVDTLDMRVYTARRGRMFRTENVLRTNGKYKVQLSVEQARSITPELYDEVTSAPGNGWQLTPPVFNPELALLFAKAREKVKAAITKRRSSKADEKLVAQFAGSFPASMQMVGRGENVREGVGFQKIATQIAITASTLGQTEQQMLDTCEGLIQNHQSDGTRYNTPQKRRKELLRMYHYMQDNPCYEFSAGGIKSLLVEGTPTPDLNVPIEDEHGALSEDEELELEDSVTMGVRFNKEGMFRKVYDKETKEYSVLRISHMGMDNVSMLKNLGSNEIVGFEVDCFLSSKFQARRKISVNSLTSGAGVRLALGGAQSASIQINDAQANALLDLLRRKAEVNNQVVTNIPREGVDIIRLPDTETETDRTEIVYAAPNNFGVLTKEGLGNRYRLSTANGHDGEFKSDLLSAPALDVSEEEAKFFDAFFKLYPKDVMARALGYHLACFLAQPIRHKARQFPMLQVYGQAGAGKTSLTQLLGSLHFYNKEQTVWSAGDMTPFALTSLLQSSGSIPVLFDEFKKRELGFKKSQDFMMIMRNNYTGNSGGKGRVSRDAGVSTLSVAQSASVAPLIFLSEEMEAQTAILDRAIIVALTEKQEKDVGGMWHFCTRNRRILGKWGHLCVRKVLNLDLDRMDEDLHHFQRQLEDAATRALAARPLFNNAVVLLGLQFGKQTLASEFGDRFDPVFDEFMFDVINGVDTSVPINQSEGSKVLSTLAALSAVQENDPYRMHAGLDYMLTKDSTSREPCVDIHLRNAWDKYSRHRRSQGEEVLYHSEAAFINAMMRHRAAVDTVCAGSELKGGRPSVKVVRFSLRTLYDQEGVEEFKDLSRAIVFPEELTNSN